VESCDFLFYEQFVQNCVPALLPYDGSSYFSSIPATINGHMPATAMHSLDPLLTPIVDRCPAPGVTLRPRAGADGAVLCDQKALVGRGSAVPSGILLAESQRGADTSPAQRFVGEAGIRQSPIIVEPVPGSLQSISQDDVAVAEASDDLEVWAVSDTAYGWAVPVDPGFVDLEAINAGPEPGNSSSVGALVPVTADIPAAHVQVNCLYVGAYLSTS
jgi:hypothetical protein